MKIRLSNSQTKFCIQLIILGLNVCLLSIRSNAQTKVDTTLNTIESSIAKDSTKIYLNPERAPEFPGGEAALESFLSKNIKYPKAAQENNTEGRVVVTFVVNDDGNIVDVKTVRGIGSGCDQEAERVVKSMPNWKPGKQNGKAVRVAFSLPITFTLE